MVVVTAADYRFQRFADIHKRQAQRLGYELDMYDLGDLGWGYPFRVKNRTFIERGHYGHVKNIPIKRTVAYHKPFIIRDALKRHSGLVVYCDADAIPVNAELDLGVDFDIGVTIRTTEELAYRRWRLGLARDESDGMVNAGVIFFNSNVNSHLFVERWIAATRRYGNDQMALNKMLPDSETILDKRRHDLGYITIRTFDAKLYNCYHFGTNPGYEGVNPHEARILHFKTDPTAKLDGLEQPRDMLHHFLHRFDPHADPGAGTEEH